MAEAILQIVPENLNSMIGKELGFLWGVEKEMQKLSSLLSTIQAVLEDAEERQLQDKALKNWLKKLKDAAYQVDDILDECATEAGRSEYQAQKCKSIYKVHASSSLKCLCSNHIVFSRKIFKKMTEVREKLDVIAQERRDFHLQERSAVAGRRVEVTERRQTGSVLTEPEVYARREDQEKIVECLVKDVANYNNLSIYPVVGMGGLGKTTLAQLVFNDERIERHFEIRIWVFVSQEFSVIKVIRKIIESVSASACEELDLDPLQRRVRDILNGKRYLLVLDDFWNEDQEDWDRLKYTLNVGTNGSSVIVTTRLAKVGYIVGTLPLHNLSGLSEEDCWLLFKQRAFGNVAEQPANILAIAKEIVKKCKGVPLAAKTLGGLMRFKSHENEWLHVKDSELWNLPQDENSILPALRLSYSNLTVQLRQCFAYCAMFPKGFEIEKESLIFLWMANGFISSYGKLEVEDVGNEMCDELHWRSLIQDIERDDSGNIRSFKMHDLVHDLVQSVMEDECRAAEAECSSYDLSRRTRHMIFTYSKQSFTIPDALYKVEFLRTLLVQPSYPLVLDGLNNNYCDILKFPSLRVFKGEAESMRLTPSIGNLKHLRYLDLSGSNINVLPKSICSLWNLQILKLQYCYHLRRLPNQMRHLRNLRHLILNGCSSLTSMPPKLRQMTALKTLSLFIVGRGTGFGLAELQGLDLRGELWVKHLERVGNLVDAKEANLGEKQFLHELTLSWGSDGGSESQGNAEEVLESLKPHPNLKKLGIDNYRGTRFPPWMSSPVLDNVVSLRLSKLDYCLQLPPLGKLPSLKYLTIGGLERVKYIDNEFYGEGAKPFQSLKTLDIYGSPSVEKLLIEEGRLIFPCLTRIFIWKNPKLRLPCLPSLEELEVRICSEVLLSSIPNLNNLTSLRIEDNDKIISFPSGSLQNLTSLELLSIEGFTDLKMPPIDLITMNALRALHIIRCHELESLPEEVLQGLTSLDFLCIKDCKKFKCLSNGLKRLSALRYLFLIGCPELIDFPDGMEHLVSLINLELAGPCTTGIGSSKLAALPEALQHIPALKYLRISKFPNLFSLPDWLDNLASLEVVDIFYCYTLNSLPGSIQNLVSLRELRILGCPELRKRCEKETGEDWYKIAHIPSVFID